MTNPIIRPTSAPPVDIVTKKKIPHYDRIELDRCSMCFKKIFGGAFMEISHAPLSILRQSICSSQCFEKYVKLNSQSDMPTSHKPVKKKLISMKPPLHDGEKNKLKFKEKSPTKLPLNSQPPNPNLSQSHIVKHLKG